MTIASDLITCAKGDVHRGQDAFTDAQWLELLNEGLRDFMFHSELREELVTETIPQYASHYDLPTDTIDIRQIRLGDDRQLTPYTETELDEEQDGWQTQVGTPDRYIVDTWNRIRLYPRTSAAATINLRHAFMPTALLSTDTLPFPKTYDDVLEAYLASNASYLLRDYENGKKWWDEYLRRLEKAKVQGKTDQRSPDTYVTQRPAHVTNKFMWKRGNW